MKNSALHSVRGPRKGRYAFTLIEMLVVISIIAVMVMIVVGVSQIVIGKAGAEQTKLNMRVIHLAIEAYREAKDEYPSDETVFPDPAAETPPWVAGIRNWRAYCRGEKLYEDLSSVPQARAQIANLSKDAIKNIHGNNVFVDGFDKYMEYFSDKGAGAAPVIISAGADGEFDTEKDIRSDNQ